MTRMRPLDWGFVVLLLLLAAALRFTGLAWGQTDARFDGALAADGLIPENTPLHPDEFLFVQIPLRMRLLGDLNPDFFHNPSLLINVNYLTYALTGTGAGQSVEPWAGTSARQQAPFPLYVIVRTYSALGGLLAVAAAYALARLIAGRFAGAAAGMLAAVSFLLVQHAHYGTTSSLAAGFAMVTLWAGFLALRRPDRARGLLAFCALMAAFAAGNRYNAAIVSIIPLVVGLVLLYRQRTWPMLRAVVLRWLIFPVVFVLSTPYFLRNPRFVLEQIRYILLEYLEFADPTFTTPYGLWFEYRYLALFGLGIPAVLALGIGLWAILRQSRGWRTVLADRWSLYGLLLLVYLVPYTLLVLRTVRPIAAEQLLIPIIAPLCVLAGMGAGWCYQRLTAPRWLVSPVLIVILCFFPLLYSVLLVYQLVHRDTRQVMQEWVYTHLPTGSRVHLNGPYNVPLDHADYVWTQNYGTQYPPASEMIAADVDYVILSDAWYYDVLRSGEIINAGYLEDMQAYLAELDTRFTRIAYLPRPDWPGSDALMHSASYWHNPTMIVYCVTAASCAAVR